jgi:hypothetical protein
MQFNNPTSTRNENKEYDNSTFRKIKWMVAFAACFPPHPARPHLLCAFADGARTTTSAITGRKLSRQQHR